MILGTIKVAVPFANVMSILLEIPLSDLVILWSTHVNQGKSI